MKRKVEFSELQDDILPSKKSYLNFGEEETLDNPPSYFIPQQYSQQWKRNDPNYVKVFNWQWKEVFINFS